MRMRKIFLGVFLLLPACSTLYKGDELYDFKGDTTEQVLYIMGKPVTKRCEGDNKMWAYCQGECYTLIFFGVDNTVQYAERRGKCLPEEKTE